jgi:hypothetical protein
MEHIMLSHIAKHLSSHNILVNSQHGFRERLSTVTQLISATNDWASCLNHQGQSDVILLDFSKAFDKVPHRRLSAKLNFYGIRGHTQGWVDAFLKNRSQAVSVNGTMSSWVDVTSGVPQGSVLGPALFLLYINDIEDSINSSIRLFADDSILYREICSPEDHVILQHDLNTLASWSQIWLMHFNISKCATLSITRKRKPSLHQYTILGQDLSRVDDHEYLGVTISHDLSWTKHCTKIANKAHRTLGLLRRTLSPCKKEVKAKAFRSLVKPQLDYAGEAWNPSTLSNINKIEQVQRQGARFVHADYRRTTSVSPMLVSLNWIPLHSNRLIQQSCMFYKIHYALVNIQFPSSIQLASFHGRHDHNLKYAIPNNSVNSYKYSFYPRTVRIWNRLSSTTVSSPSVQTFKKAATAEVLALSPNPGDKLV